MKKLWIGIALITVIIFSFGVNPGGISGTELKPVEIKEYRGEKLSGEADFRENSIKGPQYIDRDKYSLSVDGLVAKPVKYTYNQLLQFPGYQKIVTLNCVEGWSVKILWEGILVSDLLNASAVQPRGKIVIFHAADGYTTSLPVDFIIKHRIIMAAKMNGLPLKPERGFPFQLVAEDKWGYKWIKWITRIELSANTKYRGYWESRGYSNDGRLDRDSR